MDGRVLGVNIWTNSRCVGGEVPVCGHGQMLCAIVAWQPSDVA